jgi:hypothetical protein
MKKKIFLTVLILAILIIAGFFIWQSWPKGKTEVSKWQVYIEKNLGYEFKYPENWDTTKIGDTIIFAPRDTIEEINQISGGVGGGKFLTLTIHYYTAQEYQEISRHQSDEYQDVISNPIILSGIEGKRYISTILKDLPGTEKGDIYTDIVLPFKDGFLEITLLDNQFSDIFNQILSTFRFID